MLEGSALALRYGAGSLLAELLRGAWIPLVTFHARACYLLASPLPCIFQVFLCAIIYVILKINKIK